VPGFGHSPDLRRSVPLFRIEVDVEVRGLQHLKVEFAVLDLVAALRMIVTLEGARHHDWCHEHFLFSYPPSLVLRRT